ncbi:polyisoprenoid-binding protein [Listeria booriae]|uniref:Polyisoprenoid-binding protein n=1 Tax=Listeria booriae TaxID=1552123 RepID=A0A841Y1X9_9LIST|nr:YceI family protein [Listeria booriae]MBC1371716.1 polyisoprenoid-binding protein [Listeria booriae]MBC2036396.1 polyisoprenoid-binding protein [Listeria booriae]MBC2147027.1 polyisoprenoid-binding protein [Listeria booriae]MBC2179226.1 polyisoprenoid-binding protein [Listeria booriae]MBC2187800.1 polyisoprenoid-binding protein [Listeria booriae]
MTVEKWNVDPAHSSIEFQVKHMMVSKVKGAFKNFSADLTLDPEDLTTANLSFTVDAASIDTRQEQRDGHLKSPDFFDVEKYPSITFQSTNIVADGSNEYKVTGDLTIRTITKPITFNVEYEGTSKDPMSGNMVAGFEGTGKFNRKDFELNYNAVLETGGVLIGDEVKLNIQIEVSK